MDDERLRLAKAAADGDLDAAERLVALLKRERAVVSPDTKLAELAERDFGSFNGRKTRFLRACERLRIPGRPHAKVETIRDLACFTEPMLIGTKGFGEVFVSLARELVARADLSLGSGDGGSDRPPTPAERGRRDGWAGVAPRETHPEYAAAYTASRRMAGGFEPREGGT